MLKIITGEHVSSDIAAKIYDLKVIWHNMNQKLFIILILSALNTDAPITPPVNVKMSLWKWFNNWNGKLRNRCSGL